MEAADGYRVVIALPELDPGFTDKQILLADKRETHPLNDKEGPYRIVIPDEKNGEVGATGEDAEDRRRTITPVSPSGSSLR
jgi:hypothetical protein